MSRNLERAKLKVNKVNSFNSKTCAEKNIIKVKKGHENALFGSAGGDNILDTLGDVTPSLSGAEDVLALRLRGSDLDSMNRRAYAKHISYVMNSRLYQHTKAQRYFKACGCMHTVNEVLVGGQKKYTSMYCKQRSCLVCNKIRTAILINRYKDFFKGKKLAFVTLTAPTCSAYFLRQTVKSRLADFAAAKKSIKKYCGLGSNFFGVRKLEITYNVAKNMYHPHLHIICNAEAAEPLLSKWLQLNPRASKKAQDISSVASCVESDLVELFKYAVKDFTKDKKNNVVGVPVQAQHNQYKAISGVRIFQNFGFKVGTETAADLSEQQIEQYFSDFVYNSECFNWISSDAEPLTDYNSDNIKNLLK